MKCKHCKEILLELNDDWLYCNNENCLFVGVDDRPFITPKDA